MHGIVLSITAWPFLSRLIWQSKADVRPFLSRSLIFSLWTCPHGIIYTLKFVLWAESPRDYVHLLLSMAHQPNSIINDMAKMLVAHGNKRTKDMVYPFNGMVAEPTQINIQKALDGKQEVSLPWLDSGKEGNLAIQSFEVHPVLGSAKHLYLFDRLHERNVKKEEETLHCVMNITELKGKPNPQKDEKLHAPYNHDSRYLNQMKPINHIFLFRSNIDIPETHPPDQPHIFLKAFWNFASSLEIAFFT